MCTLTYFKVDEKTIMKSENEDNFVTISDSDLVTNTLLFYFFSTFRNSALPKSTLELFGNVDFTFLISGCGFSFESIYFYFK